MKKRLLFLVIFSFLFFSCGVNNLNDASVCVSLSENTVKKLCREVGASSENLSVECVLKQDGLDDITKTSAVIDNKAQIEFSNIPIDSEIKIFATVNFNKALNNKYIEKYEGSSEKYTVVDAEGKIEFPVLGSVSVLGLKTTEVADLLEERLSAQVKDPMVLVRLINAKVTVMGEVNRPGQYTMPNGRMTLLDALGAAGDLSVYGQRDNILITRETNGKLEFHRLNLNSDELFTSPFYYLQQNDVIYVSPNKVRAINSTNVSLWLSMVSTLASTATVIVTVVNASK